RRRGGPPLQPSPPLLASVDEIERQGDREQDRENHAQEQRDARERNQRRARAAPLFSFAFERLRGLDRVLDRMDHVLRLIDRMHHVIELPTGVIAYARVSLARTRTRPI